MGTLPGLWGLFAFYRIVRCASGSNPSGLLDGGFQGRGIRAKESCQGTRGGFKCLPRVPVGVRATVYNLLGLELGALKMKDHVQTVHMNNFIIDEIIYVH